jgi:hypothetical protein
MTIITARHTPAGLRLNQHVIRNVHIKTINVRTRRVPWLIVTRTWNIAIRLAHIPKS